MTETLLVAGSSIVCASIAAYGAVKANRAERNSRPVSNGFASGVNRKLDKLENLLLDHLRDHSNK